MLTSKRGSSRAPNAGPSTSARNPKPRHYRLPDGLHGRSPPDPRQFRGARVYLPGVAGGGPLVGRAVCGVARPHPPVLQPGTLGRASPFSMGGVLEVALFAPLVARGRSYRLAEGLRGHEAAAARLLLREMLIRVGQPSEKGTGQRCGRLAFRRGVGWIGLARLHIVWPRRSVALHPDPRAHALPDPIICPTCPSESATPRARPGVHTSGTSAQRFITTSSPSGTEE